MTQAATQGSITSRTIAVEHIRISSARAFAEVRRKLEATVPKLDTSIAEALNNGDQKRAKDYDENGPKLSIFGERDHGALLQIAGRRRNALQYNIGNPLTASKMTRHQLPAALYAPLRVVLFEDEQGRGIFEYDKPSSFFGQYADERVTLGGALSRRRPGSRFAQCCRVMAASGSPCLLATNRSQHSRAGVAMKRKKSLAA